jgi:hypothetical protein
MPSDGKSSHCQRQFEITIKRFRYKRTSTLTYRWLLNVREITNTRKQIKDYKIFIKSQKP